MMTPQEIEKIKEEFDKFIEELRTKDSDVRYGVLPWTIKKINDFFISHINELLKVRERELVERIERVDFRCGECGVASPELLSEIINLIQSDLSTNPSSQDEEK